MILRRTAEEYFGISYPLGQSDFTASSHFQWRDYFASGETVLRFCVARKLFQSMGEAKRSLKAGAIRVGNRDSLDSLRQCRVLKEDRPIEPNDLVRVGRKAFGIVPRPPTLREELLNLIDLFTLKFPPTNWGASKTHPRREEPATLSNCHSSHKPQ